MAEPGLGGEHLASVSIPVVVGVIGPDVLASAPMTIVELGQRSLWVEGPAPLTPGEAVALACRLPGEPTNGDGPPTVLAVAVVSGRARPEGSSWRSPLEIEQIEPADGERLASVGTRAQFRPGGSR
jgi:hypothetical protein